MLAIIPIDAIVADNIAKTSMWLTVEVSFAEEEFVEFMSLKFVSYMTRSLTKQQLSSGLTATCDLKELNLLDHPAGTLDESDICTGLTSF